MLQPNQGNCDLKYDTYSKMPEKHNSSTCASIQQNLSDCINPVGKRINTSGLVCSLNTLRVEGKTDHF